MLHSSLVFRNKQAKNVLSFIMSETELLYIKRSGSTWFFFRPGGKSLPHRAAIRYVQLIASGRVTSMTRGPGFFSLSRYNHRHRAQRFNRLCFCFPLLGMTLNGPLRENVIRKVPSVRVEAFTAQTFVKNNRPVRVS